LNPFPRRNYIFSMKCPGRQHFFIAILVATQSFLPAVAGDRAQNPVDTLRHIYLSETPDLKAGDDRSCTMSPAQSERMRRLYFSFFPDSGRILVNYRATNLAAYLKPVPDASRIIGHYAWLRIAAPVLLGTGLCLIAGTTGYQAYRQRHDEQWNFSAPDFTGAFAGVGLCLASGIPVLLSRGRVERAVERYNRHAEPGCSEP
jgi:hypothetical protein